MELNKHAQDKTVTLDNSLRSDFGSCFKSQWIIAEEYAPYSLSLLLTFSRWRMHVEAWIKEQYTLVMMHN